MRQLYWLITPIALALTGFLSSVNAAPLDAGYLTGTWEFKTQGTCGGENAEHLVINANSTFEYGRRGKAEAVGFWRLDNDVLTFDMISSPADFQDIQPELKASTGYEINSMHMVPVDMQQNQFGAVASIGDLMQQFTLQRCQ
jgi:hypothetical protein